MTKNFNSNTDNNDEWLTPPYIIKELGEFDLDPCSPHPDKRPWDTEMYWQGECEESYHYCMGTYEAICDDCFHILSNNYQKGG